MMNTIFIYRWWIDDWFHKNKTIKHVDPSSPYPPTPSFVFASSYFIVFSLCFPFTRLKKKKNSHHRFIEGIWFTLSWWLMLEQQLLRVANTYGLHQPICDLSYVWVLIGKTVLDANQILSGTSFSLRSI